MRTAFSADRAAATALQLHAKLIAAALVFTLLTYAILLFSDRVITVMAGDEQVLEQLSAAAYGAASVLCALAARRLRSGSHHIAGRAVLIGFALLFFLACGEELSWGQHLLHFKTPDLVATANRQDELNIHNLRFLDSRDTTGARKGGLGFLLNSNRFLDYFMFSTFLALPLVVRRRDVLGELARKVGLPRISIGFAAPLALNYALTAAAMLATDRTFMSRATSEIRETNSSVLCFVFALYLFYSQTAAKSQPR